MPKLKILPDTQSQGLVSRAQEGGRVTGVQNIPQTVTAPQLDLTPLQRGLYSSQEAIQYQEKMAIAETKINSSAYKNQVGTEVYKFDQQMKSDDNVDNYPKYYEELQANVNKLSEKYSEPVRAYSGADVQDAMKRAGYRMQGTTRIQKVKNMRTTSDKLMDEWIGAATPMTKDTVIKGINEQLETRVSTEIDSKQFAGAVKTKMLTKLDNHLLNQGLESNSIDFLQERIDELNGKEDWNTITKDNGRENFTQKYQEKLTKVRGELNKNFINLTKKGQMNKPHLDTLKENGAIQDKVYNQSLWNLQNGYIKEPIPEQGADATYYTSMLTTGYINTQQAQNGILGLNLTKKEQTAYLNMVKEWQEIPNNTVKQRVGETSKLLAEAYKCGDFSDDEMENQKIYQGWNSTIKSIMQDIQSQPEDQQKELLKQVNTTIQKSLPVQVYMQTRNELAMGIPPKKEKSWWSNFFVTPTDVNSNFWGKK